jgi:purine nucleosidase
MLFEGQTVRVRLLIDTDTASDDAVAMLLALTHRDVEVVGITVVAGNVGLERAVQNALITLEQAGQPDLPVHSGAAGPLVRPLETAQFVHGADGMGDIGLPLAARTSVTSADAVEALLRAPTEFPGCVLVTLGPLTNVALALTHDPLLLNKYEHVVMMAGAPDGVGNVNALGEFNVWADPEAARAVLRAPGNKTMVGWNISRLYAVMTPSDQAHLGTLGPLGQFVQKINVCVDEYARGNGLAGYDLPDPISMAIAINPSIATRTELQRIDVLLEGEHERGFTVPSADPDIALTRVVWEADEAAFKAMIFAMCQEREAMCEEPEEA